MDAFLQSAHDLANVLMPTVILVVLVFIMVLLYRMIKLFKTLDETVKRSHKTIDLVDTSLKKIQAPLDSAVKISRTVDRVHEAGITAFKQSKDYLSRNSKAIKDKLSNTFKKKNKESVPIPSGDDIIKGE